MEHYYKQTLFRGSVQPFVVVEELSAHCTFHPVVILSEFVLLIFHLHIWQKWMQNWNLQAQISQNRQLPLGASVAKWLAHSPFTSEAAGSSPSENFLNATRTQSSCEKSKSQRSAESRGFPPGTPVSSHRESWQGGLGKKGPQ
jgi:hypothetical protein